MSSNKAEDLIDFNLRHAWHKISRMYNQKAKSHGLTMSIGFILLIVDREGTPSTQLGPRMGMEPTSLSRTLKTMETKGFIYRKIDGVDKRKVLIFLTEEGVKVRREVKEVVLDFNKKLLENIPAHKLKAFYEVMEVIGDTVDFELN
jgi:DNA-binding MarR family transcriptional regulator